MDLASRKSVVVTESMVDPVEHLRAAALSTLKGKRRKQAQALEKSMPLPTARPPPTESVQLDYGMDEHVNSNTTTADKQAANFSHVGKEPKPFAGDEEGQLREEGEISEEDEPPMRRNASPMNKSFASDHAAFTAPNGMEQTRYPISIGEPLSSYQSTQELVPTPSLLERLSEPAPHIPIFKQEEEDHSITLAQSNFDLSEDTLLSFGSLDSEHVRPGLTMTQAEYDTVKDIILDLLGWGVSFEYLIQSGISKTVLYYVFTELNLRLPGDFDMTGIVPYTQDTVTHLQRASSISRGAPTTAWETGLTTKLPTNTRTPPMTPGPLQESPIDSDLHDMERQRRQELMARKAAVQASRKLKQTQNSSDGIKPIAWEDVTMNSILNESVDDFLKIVLGPSRGLESPQSTILSPPDENNPTMLIEVTNPSNVTTVQNTSNGVETNNLGPSTPSEVSFAEPPPSSAEPPPTSVDSTTTSFSLASEESVDMNTLPASSIKPPPIRRSTQRPVASDFVDVESSPRKNMSASRIERPDGQATGITRRLNKGASFHNIGGSRRVVIDLSDSEGEEETPASLALEQQQRGEDRIWERKLLIKRSSTIPVKPSDALSTASLELEIRKMRELIAQREEETRLRKLAALVKSQSNSGTRTPLTIITPSFKVEDVDVVMSVTEPHPAHSMPQHVRDPDSATPPPENFGISSSDDDDTPSVPPSAVVQTTESHVDTVPHIPDNEERTTSAVMFERPETLVPDTVAEKKEPIQQQQSLMTERSVDADLSQSSSAQKELSTTTMLSSALQKQGAKKQDLMQSASSSNEFNESQTHDAASSFAAYHSVFDSYPRLRGRPKPMPSGSYSFDGSSSVPSTHTHQPTRHPLLSDSQSVSTNPPTFSASFLSSEGFSLPDLRPLKLASMVKLIDPRKRLCRYEIPGGGTCRDNNCTDIHLSKLESIIANEKGVMEPSDEDAAQYLFKNLPDSWLTRRQIDSPSQILAVLKHLHNRTLNNPLRYEDRVAQALLSIGSSPAS